PGVQVHRLQLVKKAYDEACRYAQAATQRYTQMRQIAAHAPLSRVHLDSGNGQVAVAGPVFDVRVHPGGNGCGLVITWQAVPGDIGGHLPETVGFTVAAR